MKTSGIKLSELRPCDHCGGPITPIFHVVTAKMAVFNRQNVNSVLGVSQMFSHKSLALAEVLAPGTDRAVEVMEEPEAIDCLFLCNKCFCDDLNLAVISESVAEKIKKTEGT